MRLALASVFTVILVCPLFYELILERFIDIDNLSCSPDAGDSLTTGMYVLLM